jgi:raffinose/stachyose/melibiose transport system substrate-binding protein
MKKTAIIWLALVMVFVLAACGGNNTANNGGSNSPGASNKGNDSAKSGDAAVTLKVIHWINEGTNTYYEGFNKRFTEKYPNIKVDYTIVPSDATYDQLQQTRINANDTDLLAIKSGFAAVPQDWSPGAQDPTWKQWIDAGLIADLTDEPFIGNYNANDVANSTTYNGKVYGVNLGKVAFTGLFYNKKIFADNGLSVPTTWNELLQTFKTLEDKGIEPLGFAGKDVWPFNLAVQGLSASIHDDQLAWIKGTWDGSTKYTDPIHLEILGKAQTMMEHAIDTFMGIDYGSLPGLFATEQVAMIADGSWNAAAIKSANPELEFGYFPIPGSDVAAKNTSLAGKYDMSWMVLEKSKNKDAAMKWLAMHSEAEEYAEFIRSSGFQPTQDNVQVDDPFLAEISPYLGNFKLAWDQLFINRQNTGQYIAGSSIHAEFLSPGGPLKTPQELAEKSQADWDAAK